MWTSHISAFASERPKAYDAYSRVPGTKKMVQMVRKEVFLNT